MSKDEARETEMTDLEYAEDLKVMIEADMGHMISNLSRGNRVLAHGHLDAIIDNARELENVLRRTGQTVTDRREASTAQVMASWARALAS
jgi:hypothetical protein